MSYWATVSGEIRFRDPDRFTEETVTEWLRGTDPPSGSEGAVGDDAEDLFWRHNKRLEFERPLRDRATKAEATEFVAWLTALPRDVVASAYMLVTCGGKPLVWAVLPPEGDPIVFWVPAPFDDAYAPW